MNKSLNLALAFLFAGSASLAVALSPKESFGDMFAAMQEASSNSSNRQRDKPVFIKAPTEVGAGLSLREMQALSCDSSGWQIDQGEIEFDHGETFTTTQPNGLSFSQYHPYAANSGEFALPPNADMWSIAGTGPVNVAGDIVKPTLGERIASLLIVGAGRTRVR